MSSQHIHTHTLTEKLKRINLLMICYTQFLLPLPVVLPLLKTLPGTLLLLSNSTLQTHRNSPRISPGGKTNTDQQICLAFIYLFFFYNKSATFRPPVGNLCECPTQHTVSTCVPKTCDSVNILIKDTTYQQNCTVYIVHDSHSQV